MPQGSGLGPLFFLIYINDSVDDLSSEAKLFAYDTSLFTIGCDEAIAADQLNRDLSIISDWADQWKMQFNLDKNKQAVQVIFCCQKYNPINPPFIFNQSEVVKKDEHTHLGMILDSKLNFNVREAIIKARRGIGIISASFQPGCMINVMNLTPTLSIFHSFPATYHLTLLMVCTFRSS